MNTSTASATSGGLGRTTRSCYRDSDSIQAALAALRNSSFLKTQTLAHRFCLGPYAELLCIRYQSTGRHCTVDVDVRAETVESSLAYPPVQLTLYDCDHRYPSVEILSPPAFLWTAGGTKSKELVDRLPGLLVVPVADKQRVTFDEYRFVALRPSQLPKNEARHEALCLAQLENLIRAWQVSQASLNKLIACDRLAGVHNFRRTQ